MTVPKQLRVEITLPIDPPHPFIAANAGNPETLATKVWWGRVISEESDHTYTAVLAEDGMNRSYWPSPFIPDWVPQPPASWHAIVSELAAEVLEVTYPADRLRTIAEGPLDLPPVAWEPPSHISRRATAEWDDPALGGPSVHLSPAGTSWHPLIYIGDETMSVEQAEVAARHLLAAVAMAREVTR